MNIDSTKARQPLGQVLIALEEWKRLKLRKKLQAIGVSQGQWKGFLTYAQAYNLSASVRDIIVEELPETAELFNHPNLKSESEVSQ